MHETVTRTRRQVIEQGVQDGLAALASSRFQEGGLSRALADPLGAQLDMACRGAARWLRLVDRVSAAGPGENVAELLGELIFTSRQLRVVLGELVGFLERAEDNLSHEDIPSRESGYEREIAPFSRMDSTEAFRLFLSARGGFTPRLAAEGAQAEADLLKLAYMERRLRDSAPKRSDLYAMVVELLLDTRRHLLPPFEEGSHFIRGLDAMAARTV